MVGYRRLQKYAIAISILSIVYCSAEGAVSIAFGELSSSRSLTFFGIQSGIEVASAAIVVWRFRKVAKPGEEQNAVLSPANLRIERYSTWDIGLLIALLALATEITAIVGLAQHTRPDASDASLIISASALILMIIIWLPKRYLARALNSSTMAGEATCSLNCIQSTTVLFVGALIYRLWRGGWWVDDATSLILGMLFARDAWKMLAWARNPNFNGGCCSSCHGGGKAGVSIQLAEGAASTDTDVERGEKHHIVLVTYRDLCECCNEKEECRDSDVCKCSLSTSDAEPCCVPLDENGAKCCSREIIQGTRPQSAIPSPPLAAESPSCMDKCCSDTVKNENQNAETKKTVETPSSSSPRCDGDISAHGSCRQGNCCGDDDNNGSYVRPFVDVNDESSG